MIEVKDEILEGEPQYRGIDSSGNIVFNGITLEMITKVIQPGTPINKKLFDSIQEDLNSSYRNIPKGLICMWSGSTVPTGWYLCDGTNGTPDLRDRFVVGAGSEYSVGATGGEKEHTLTIEEMPSHTHNVMNVPGNSGSYANQGSSNGATRTLVTTATGGGQPHENRPPYYALAFIMKA